MTMDGFSDGRPIPFWKLLHVHFEEQAFLLLSPRAINSSPGVCERWASELNPGSTEVSSLVCIFDGFLWPGSFPSDYNNATLTSNKALFLHPSSPTYCSHCFYPKLPTLMLMLPYFLSRLHRLEFGFCPCHCLQSHSHLLTIKSKVCSCRSLAQQCLCCISHRDHPLLLETLASTIPYKCFLLPQCDLGVQDPLRPTTGGLVSFSALSWMISAIPLHNHLAMN